MIFLFAFLLLGCCHQGMCQQARQLSAKEIAQIKSDIIKRSQRNAQDLLNLDYKGALGSWGKSINSVNAVIADFNAGEKRNHILRLYKITNSQFFRIIRDAIQPSAII